MRRLLWNGFEGAGSEIQAMLSGFQDELERALPRWAADEAGAWPFMAGDRSQFVNELNTLMDGRLAEAGAHLIDSWPLRNTGTVPWENRLLYLVGRGGPHRLHAPPFIPVPTTEPGQTVIIRAPVRVPRHPGTFRASYKIGWPDGRYCHPTTLAGVVSTVVVPPTDLTAWWPEPYVPLTNARLPDFPLKGAKLGELLRTARKQTGRRPGRTRRAARRPDPESQPRPSARPRTGGSR